MDSILDQIERQKLKRLITKNSAKKEKYLELSHVAVGFIFNIVQAL